MAMTRPLSRRRASAGAPPSPRVTASPTGSRRQQAGKSAAPECARRNASAGDRGFDFAPRSPSFFASRSAGIPKSGYVVIGAVFGLGPDIALAVSLLKRGRDLVLGVPSSWRDKSGKVTECSNRWAGEMMADLGRERKGDIDCLLPPSHSLDREPQKARRFVTTRPLRVGVLVDLPFGPHSGGHVKCWMRLAEAAG